MGPRGALRAEWARVARSAADRLVLALSGNQIRMVREDPEVPEELLRPSEALDSDEVRNDDGDIVVDPPDNWSEADRFGVTADEQREGESLDSRLAEEEPDVFDSVVVDDEIADEEGPLDILPARVHRGQVSGTPEDGDSLYTVED
jgi:hypothetical protein